MLLKVENDAVEHVGEMKRKYAILTIDANFCTLWNARQYVAPIYSSRALNGGQVGTVGPRGARYNPEVNNNATSDHTPDKERFGLDTLIEFHFDRNIELWILSIVKQFMG